MRLPPCLFYRACSASGLLLLGACGGDRVTSEFPPVYYAGVYGVVTQAGAPAVGVAVQGEVYASACPPTGVPEGGDITQTGANGHYRLLVSSSSPAPGQCVTLRLAEAATSQVQRTLPVGFGAVPEPVRDSVAIDVQLP